MTGQDLLDTMELLNQELQLQSGEGDVTRGLLALNIAQDHMESVFATHPDVLGGQVGTVVTVASTETTAFPTGVLRIDGLQMLDSNSRPIYNLKPFYDTGGHARHFAWPYYITSSLSNSGKPVAYYTNGRNIYWSPLPDDVHTIRWYGFQAASDITAGGTFAYPDVVRLPLATFAVRLAKMGVDDAVADIDSLAQATFGPVVGALSRFKRERAAGLDYTRSHEV